MNQTRCRIAPSPTGAGHLGLARTCLYNFAWIKKHGGTLVLRIEDTDQERSTAESEREIIDSLRWLGLDWNEGVSVGGEYPPYRQTERKDTYRYFAEKLIAEGKAYRCYCTEEELSASREALAKVDPKAGWRYPRTCLGIENDPTRPHVVRLIANTEGSTTFDDLIFGKSTMSNVDQQDIILIRSDGISTYNYAVVIDDALMKISLVGRARDHYFNTFTQIAIYEALGFTPPQFAHMGLLRSQTNEKLSKRHGAVSIAEYRSKGYSPNAILNYLARLGWSKDNMEVFSLEEFIEAFSWDQCVKNDAKFDPEKFLAINYAHLKSERLTPNSSYAHYTLPFLQAKGLNPSLADIERTVHTIRPRAKTFLEAADMLEFFFRPELVVDPAASEQFLNPTTKPKLQGIYKVLSDTQVWDEPTLKTNINNWLATMKLPMSEVGQPMRVAITGKTRSPDLFQVMNVLGKVSTLERLAKQL